MWVWSIGGMIPTQEDKYSQRNLLQNWSGKESGFVVAKEVERSQQIKVILLTILVNKDMAL